MEHYLSSLPEPLQQLALALLMAAMLFVLHLSAKQDINTSVFSSLLQWAFGAVILCIRLTATTERFIEFMGLLFVAFIYAGYVSKTYLAFRANQPKQPTHVQ